MIREQCAIAALDFWIQAALDPDTLAEARW
jgi:hypothetical protein